MTSRRQFLRVSLAAGGAALAAYAQQDAVHAGRALQAEAACLDPFAGGRLVGTVPLTGVRASRLQLETMLGEGLNARWLTDLSTLTPDTLTTPADRFFVRTRYSDRLTAPDPWAIRLHGLVRQPVDLRLDALAALVRPMGPCLIECAGNSNPNNFGLMSAADWEGISMTDVLRHAEILPSATRVLVSGFDEHSATSRGSQPGAGWIFTFDELERQGAFLATAMNGELLLPDHGRPVRLVVPRWYGCTCTKWVNAIQLVDDSVPATSQMREFARRTHQDGIPDLARDYRPAAMDQAAMPIRVEQWTVDGEIRYQVVGILWGGERPTDSLVIRFDFGELYQPIDVCPRQTTNDTWTLWSHSWRPTSPGRYSIVLQIDDPMVPTQRLDLFFYTREIRIDHV